MRAGTEIRATIWTLLALQLTTSVGAIALFTRMAPAIQNILEENVVSMEAVEQMLHALASTDKARASRFERALARAEANVTEEEERPVLRRLRDQHRRALQGEPAALAQTLAALQRVASINLEAMQRSDRNATRLGDAGGWAMAALGMLCFVVSFWAARKVVRHITRPLSQIHETIAAFRGGDAGRRCAIHDTTPEIAEIARTVNELLDISGRPSVAEPTADRDRSRAALLALLDEHARPTVVIARDGQVIAANHAALEALGQDASLRQRVLDRARGADEQDTDVRAVEPDLWIVRLDAPPTSP
jgi:nitrogen fixation/metabolism regulation signal transduction histidine kinase